MRVHRTAQAVAAFALLMMAIGAVTALWGSQEKVNEKTIFAMDTVCTVKVRGGDPKDICDEIIRLDGIFDCHSVESEISKLNESGSAQLSTDARELISRSIQLSKKYPDADISIGAVTKLWDITGEDPKVPDDEKIALALKSCGYENIRLDGNLCTLDNAAQLDVGAVAKGYALDRAKYLLEKSGAEYAVVSMGSSALMFGNRPDGEEFTVAVKDPQNKDEELLRFKTTQCFVSTSGGYERYFEADSKRYIHIFDKTTARPAETDLASVTVISSDGLSSDQLATSIFIGGTKKLGEYFKDKSIKLIAVDTQGNIHISKELEEKITLEQSEHKIIVEQ